MEYAYDVLFTVIIIHNLVVFYWRGCYEVLDLYLYPQNKLYSLGGSFAIGYILIAFLCVLQPTFNAIYRKYLSGSAYKEVWKWILELVTYLFSNFVNVSVWRGTFMFCDCYLLPDQKNMGGVVALIVALGVLMLMSCSQSIVAKGCDIDGDSSDELVCFCPTKYIRFITKSKIDRNKIVDDNKQDLWSVDGTSQTGCGKPSGKPKVANCSGNPMPSETIQLRLAAVSWLTHYIPKQLFKISHMKVYTLSIYENGACGGKPMGVRMWSQRSPVWSHVGD